MITPPYLINKTILITGGTGSFGSAFAKFLLAFPTVKKVIIFSRDELKQSELAERIRDKRLRFFLGDVRDEARLRRAFFGVDIIVHAAALKQVPTLEYNPFEAVKTNILGSENVINAAIDAGVERVLLISTDKAVEPVNLYGSTKQVAEKLFVAGNFYSAGRTRFAAVRYGNVLGSRGSIVERLRDPRSAGEVGVTDERMTRFFLSLPESFKLVLYALSSMQGGEIFLPKRIPSMKITDLVRILAPKARVKIIGRRPGEKLHEALLTSEEARRTMDMGEYLVVLPDQSGFEGKRAKYKKGTPLPEDYSLRSDESDFHLTEQGLKALLRTQA